jgi:nucleoside 2-deoxyribosyltransferase
MNQGEARKKAFISGRITGDTNYKAKFRAAEEELYDSGYSVMNPAILPEEGFAWEAYMRICEAMLLECDDVFFLRDWKDSRGAAYEYGLATARGKRVFFYDDFIEQKYAHKCGTGEA